MVNFLLYPYFLVSFLCSPCSKVLPTKKKFKITHHRKAQTPISYIISLKKIVKQEAIFLAQLCAFPTILHLWDL